MLVRLFLLFTLVPLAEFALLWWIAQHTGLLFTIALVIGTGVAGASLARHQGLRCWVEVQRQLAQGQIPAEPLWDGLMILVAGALLITPGVLTDLVGFALLVPPIRRLVRRHLAARFKSRIMVRRDSHFPGWSTRQGDLGDEDVADADVIDVEHRPSEMP